MRFFPDLLRVRGHTIWTKPLGPESIVVDAGAHRGEFSRELKQRFGCTCWPVEANPRLAAQLHADHFGNTIAAALGANDGKSRFVLRDNLESGGIMPREADGNAETAEVEVTSLRTLMRRSGLSRIDLLKLDIEGAEFDLIAKTPDDLLRGIRQITVEFHDFLPEFRGRGFFEQAKQRLARLGFVCWPMAFRTHGDVLFLNRDTSGLGAFSCCVRSVFGRWEMKLRGP